MNGRWGSARRAARYSSGVNPDNPITAAPTQIAPGRFQLVVPDGWLQGRGAFGGLVLAPMVRAALLVATPGPERRVRTLTAEIVAPVLPGAADLSVEELRAGSGTTTLAVRLLQEGELRAHGVVVIGRARKDAPVWRGSIEMKPWRDAAPIPDGAL